MKFKVFAIILILVLSSIIIDSNKKKITTKPLVFEIVDVLFDNEKKESELLIKVHNRGYKSYNLKNFIVYIYDSNENVIVSSTARACLKENCTLNRLESREFKLIVGVDARTVSYIEYSLD